MVKKSRENIQHHEEVARVSENMTSLLQGTADLEGIYYFYSTDVTTV